MIDSDSRSRTIDTELNVSRPAAAAHNNVVSGCIELRAQDLDVEDAPLPPAPHCLAYKHVFGDPLAQDGMCGVLGPRFANSVTSISVSHFV
ncbi:hypothetical protein [Burkholderia gladioli]|uniref:hypothetical protein n=1 Tax=Burkholderia gladioli TaxID=28095 RepID=UPI001374B7FD|nr:hypothetical protein [Burkholderia gladioli]